MSIKRVVIDDNILIKDEISTAGSKILYNFVPPFSSAVYDKLTGAGISGIKQSKPNEFGTSLTEGFGCVRSVADGEADIGVGCDVNGSIRKEAAKNNVFFIKPTYGTVSRFGLVSTSPSMEQIGVACTDVETGFEALSLIAGYDERDGAAANAEKYSFTAPAEDLAGLRIGVISGCAEELKEYTGFLRAAGAETGTVDFPLLKYAPAVCYIISSAETSNSISRFDGVKFGYRPEEYTSFEDIYVKSRSECFTFETKLFALIGLLVLTKEKYDGCFDKSLKIRRLIKEAVDSIFEKYDAIITTTGKSDDFRGSYENLRYLALPNLTGCPAMAVPGGFQFIAKAGDESTLLRIGKNLGRKEAAL